MLFSRDVPGVLCPLRGSDSSGIVPWDEGAVRSRSGFIHVVSFSWALRWADLWAAERCSSVGQILVFPGNPDSPKEMWGGRGAQRIQLRDLPRLWGRVELNASTEGVSWGWMRVARAGSAPLGAKQEQKWGGSGQGLGKLKRQRGSSS